MSRTYALCVLANDATTNDTKRVYTGLGPNSRQRVDEALQWVAEKLPTATVWWLFGAGTAKAWRRGPTLGVLASAYLRRQAPHQQCVFANESERHYFGTHEEMKWSVRLVERTGQPSTVTFIFFGPEWHLRRAKFIWSLFFASRWGEARFVPTADGAKPSALHEALGYLKVVGHLTLPGIVKTRDQRPYPPIS